ncbi:MAG: hypothetical protein M5U26_09045 [Planctomycetota bacterium]|nr:hypothetical protein [Planctomycetota bacterium]
MLGKLATVAANGFKESIRQPVYVVLLVGGSLLLALNLAICGYAFEDDNKLLLDLGLSTLFVAGLLLAAFSATGVFNREIENKTVLTVVSKPVSRPAFVLGKYLGVTAALGVAFTIWALVFQLTVRHGVMSRADDPFDMPVILLGGGALALAFAGAGLGNYFFNWVFASALTAGLAPLMLLAYGLALCLDKNWALQPPGRDFNAPVWIAVLCIFQALAVLSAVAVAVSTRLGQVMTLSICAAVFLLGLSSDYLFGGYREERLIARVAYGVVPNLNFHWLAEALHGDHGHLGEFAPLVGLVSAYSALYVAAILGVAVALFQTREVG